jgi:hypothetical protein
MSEVTTVETVEVEAKVSGKRRDLVKIGRHLARQISKGTGAPTTVEGVMERKLVDRVQAKAIIKHAEKLLAARGVQSPFAAA